MYDYSIMITTVIIITLMMMKEDKILKVVSSFMKTGDSFTTNSTVQRIHMNNTETSPASLGNLN